jgi:nucleotide-binding universal stress UspA family protein
MKTILFPTDFNTATTALSWAWLFARQPGARLVLLHVFQPIIPDSTLPSVGPLGMGVEPSLALEDISRNQLLELANQLRAEGLTVTTDWRIDNVEDGILTAAQDCGADLIITGRSELANFFDRIVGTSAAGVARHAHCPVLIVPAHSAPPHAGETQKPIQHQWAHPAHLRQIVFASSLQVDETAVMRQVVEIANTFGASVQVLKVHAENQPNVFDDADSLASLQREFGADRLQVTTIQARTVSGGLQDFLHEHNTDLLVMTTHARDFFDRLLSPSLTERMVLRAELPLLVFHG